MISVLLEGTVGSDANVLAKEAEQCSKEGGWKYKIIDGRRRRARAEVTSIVSRYEPELLVICCADEVRTAKRRLR